MNGTYEIPSQLLATITDLPGVVLHEGIWVDTEVCGQTFAPEDALCAFCDGSREVSCPTCDQMGGLEGGEKCPTCTGTGNVRCPQARSRRTHE